MSAYEMHLRYTRDHIQRAIMPPVTSVISATRTMLLAIVLTACGLVS